MSLITFHRICDRFAFSLSTLVNGGGRREEPRRNVVEHLPEAGGRFNRCCLGDTRNAWVEPSMSPCDVDDFISLPCLTFGPRSFATRGWRDPLPVVEEFRFAEKQV